MAIRKFTSSESVEVLDTKGTDVISSHLTKTAKTSVAELTEEELAALREDLAVTTE